MTEQQLTNEIRQCCDRVLTDRTIVDKEYVDNMHFIFHDGLYSWVEYCGTKLSKYDSKAIDILGRIVRAVCYKHNIVFINTLAE